jgi:hypothetical protein
MSSFEDAADDLGRAWDERRKKRDGNGQWPEPHPLPDSLLPVASFDFGLIPEKTRHWIDDICERMQCPPDYTAVSLMAALGSMIGRKVAIRPQCEDDWEVFANQWALLIGRPGVLKKPSDGGGAKPTTSVIGCRAGAARKGHGDLCGDVSDSQAMSQRQRGKGKQNTEERSQSRCAFTNRG